MTKNYTGFVVELHEGVLDMKGFSSTARQKTVVVQPLSDQNWVNRAFGGHLKNGRYATIYQKLRGVEPSLLTLYIYGFWGVDFRKGIAEYIMPLYPPFWRPFKQNGGHFQGNRPISETKGRRVSILTLCLCFVGHRFHRKYCRIHYAIASTILEAI